LIDGQDDYGDEEEEEEKKGLSGSGGDIETASSINH
jgi:hypothetical protein